MNDKNYYVCYICKKHFQIAEQWISISRGFLEFTAELGKMVGEKSQYFDDIRFHYSCFEIMSGEEFIVDLPVTMISDTERRR